MSKVAIVYWSGTGNTEQMADLVLQGAQAAGAQASVLRASEFDAEQMDAFDAVAFGCPSMGVEELEETEFAPMFDACKSKLQGKRIALFGSYGWGDGEWMRNWEEACIQDGAQLVHPYVICNEAPDEQAQLDCQALGRALATSAD